MQIRQPAAGLGRAFQSKIGPGWLALLCGTFEAVVGALYLDAGMSAVQDFIEPRLVPVASQILEALTAVGAADVAVVGVTTTSAVSCRPASSVTVRRTVKEPDEGATTVAVSVFAPTMPGGLEPPFTMVHA